MFDWKIFLQDYSRAILASPDVAYFGLPTEVVKTQWLGFDGATAEQIATAEKRLGAPLPPSYRAFLQVSNGWRTTGTFIDRILPVEEIYWLRDSPDSSLLEHVDLYVRQLDEIPYNPEFDSVDFAHFYDTLVIAEPTAEQEMLLLNPKVKGANGEWQAWAFGHWIPGAEGYDSFQVLLEVEYYSLVEANELDDNRFDVADSSDMIASKVDYLIKLLEDDIRIARPDPNHSDHPTYKHAQARADGMQEVLDHVKHIQQETTDPHTLYQQLGDLIAEYQAKHRASLPDSQTVTELSQSVANGITADDPNLQERINQMVEYSLAHGNADGWMQAISKIQFFLQ